MARTEPVLVDSNVILDIAFEDSRWREWSEEAIERAAGETVLVMNPIIYAEVSIGYAQAVHVEAVMPTDRFRREALPHEAAFGAGKAFLAYRRRGGTRTSPLPDFYIGAHAAVRQYRLLTRDATRYRNVLSDGRADRAVARDSETGWEGEMQDHLTPAAALPADGTTGTLIGRVWLPGDASGPPGPAVVAIRENGVFDISRASPTVSELLNADNPAALARGEGARIGDLEAILANSAFDRREPGLPWLLAPCDLQAIKACGVTFATSMLERVIEEQARGDASKALAIRAMITGLIGTDLSKITPGSDAAMRLKAHLIEQKAWSQYLEVGIGKDAEVFTKCPPMASVGTGSEIGILSGSDWNNPEPELVLAINAQGRIVGATLGNDVNLRDVEGRSALLLGKAKDNNASCAIGPFIRLLDDSLSLDQLRVTTISLRVRGEDGFSLSGASSMAEISRDITDLSAQTIGANHQYPDGALLFTGTMFAPIHDRDHLGQGFTHKVGDLVEIACPELGRLVNRVDHCERIAPWTFGAGALMHNLARRKLL